jgi:hypothetical protein
MRTMTQVGQYLSLDRAATRHRSTSSTKRAGRTLAAVVFAILVGGGCRSGSQSTSFTPTAAAPVAAVAPSRGSLVVVGGGLVGREIVARFLELAGGPSAPIVLIPTAIGDSAYAQDCACARLLRERLANAHLGTRTERELHARRSSCSASRSPWSARARCLSTGGGMCLIRDVCTGR